MMIKLFYTIHRVLGTLLSILFFVWFVSGIVMIYHTFPRATPNEKMEKLEPLPVSLPSVDEVLSRIPDSCMVTGMSVSNYLGQTLFEVQTDKGIIKLPADSTEEIPVINRERINRIVKLWCNAPVASMDTLYHLDQWIPFGQLKKHFPIYKFKFTDEDKTQIYVSSVTGDVLQCTNREERFWAWLGAIPHWVYFTQLRQDVDLWIKSVVWLSALGALMTIAGLYIGIHGYRVSRKKQGKWRSPYKKKWYYWHHVTGIIFGLFVLTWVFSGMMSLADVPGWIGKVHQEYPVRRVMNENAPQLSAYPLDYRKVIENYQGKITHMEWKHFRAIPYYQILTDNKKQTIDASSAEVTPLNLTENQILEAVKAIHGDSVDLKGELLTEYDNYYIARSGHLPLPVWKIKVDNADKTTYYINPENGNYRDFNTHKRWGFWMYSGMHSLRIKFLIDHPVLWSIVMWTLLIGGSVVSFTGIVLGVRYLKRVICRKRQKSKAKLQ